MAKDAAFQQPDGNTSIAAPNPVSVAASVIIPMFDVEKMGTDGLLFKIVVVSSSHCAAALVHMTTLCSPCVIV